MRKIAIIFLILISAAVGVYLGYLKSRQDYPRPTGPTICLSILDSDRGAGAVIKTPEGAWLVIDPGPASKAKPLVDHLRWMGAEKFDVVITSPTRARIGALPSLLDAFEVGRVIHGPKQLPTHTWTDTVSDLESRGIKERTITAGDTINLSKTASIAVLSPPADLLPGVSQDSADNALVLQLRYGGKRFLLTSDIRTTAEAHLIKLGATVESDVLLLAHCGRYGSNCLEFISRVRPAFCILTCGGYLGNPSPSVLRRVDRKNSGADLYRTDKDGTIEVISDGCRISVDTHVGGG